LLVPCPRGKKKKKTAKRFDLKRAWASLKKKKKKGLGRILMGALHQDQCRLNHGPFQVSKCYLERKIKLYLEKIAKHVFLNEIDQQSHQRALCYRQ
jgi:hypothetical protein